MNYVNQKKKQVIKPTSGEEARSTEKQFKHRLKKFYPNLFDLTTDGVMELEDRHFIRERLSGEMKCIHPQLKDKYSMIMFYAPWCEMSKSFTHSWSALALPGGLMFPYTSVNCEQQRKIANQLKIIGYPNFKVIYPDGTLRGYNGPRTIHHFEKMMVNLSKIHTNYKNY